MTPHTANDVNRVFRALCNPARLAILLVLANGPASAVAIQTATGATREALRKHLLDLRKARLIERPHWRHGDVPYSLAPGRASASEDELMILASGIPITVGRYPLQDSEAKPRH